jgi:pimeloyl-ACP methyl ester carboxylesterase
MVNAQCREFRLRDGRTLAYAEFGSPSGHPIVYCHGAPSSRVEGDLLLDSGLLRTLGLRVIVPDRPGIGRSDFQRGRRIVDWPADVLELADALHLDAFAVVGESGGSPYAAACGALLSDRVEAIGLIGCLAPADSPGALAAMAPPLRAMFRLARVAPPVLRGLFRLNLRMIRNGGDRATRRMAASFPEPDRTLLHSSEIRDGFMTCFVEACRQGTAGPAWDLRLIAGPWGFDPARIAAPVFLWHGERDGNVPVAHGRYLASVFPNCRATFYADDAHLSVPLNHHREIFSAVRSALSVDAAHRPAMV